MTKNNLKTKICLNSDHKRRTIKEGTERHDAVNLYTSCAEILKLKLSFVQWKSENWKNKMLKLR